MLQVTFYHPDFTVGAGISPAQLSLVDFTTGVELHQPLKINIQLADDFGNDTGTNLDYGFLFVVKGFDKTSSFLSRGIKD